ncbi:MAG: VCBS domain-containing protein, partial [Altererythrobacter sp.]|uniref:beta strand repeat-containing protein n=1 Tax=Altererythrobacter sp. TaxID=1872480 RepID=UPI001B15D9B1
MVDFEGGKRGGFELENGVEDSLNPGSNSLQETTASSSNGTRVLAADANGVVVLPEGVSLDDITVVGRDLVINLADGSQIIIPDGAIIVPQLVIDGVAVPPLNLAALLNDAEINPEAEPTQVPSSGGNFAGDVGPIQDAFDLGDLLPYTDLARVVEEEEEVLPDIVNREPDVVIETPDNPVGVENAIATVAERGLPERGSEPEGTASETDAETTTGTIVFNAPDGLSAILINGVEISSVGQVFSSPFGDLTITSIDLANGEIGFSYTLADNLVGETVDGFFEATVIDRDGDTANASLSIIVEDDSPIAADDIGIVPAGTHDPITGNVLDNDESGADDYSLDGAVSGFSNATGSADAGETLQGEYGTLTLNADGSYTYTRDVNTPGGVEESFDYTIVDQDGSTSTATLTITIEDAPDTIEIPSIGDGTVVDEAGLPPRGDEPVGSGEGADGDPDDNSDPSETTGSTITFNSPDGVDSITINGVEVNLGNDAGNDADDQVIIDDATGTLVITSVTYDPVTGDGTIVYEYTLGDNTDGDDTSVSFDVVVTDLDGDVAEDTLTITIIDDVPTAADDAAQSVAEDAVGTIGANVLANDTQGADGATVTSFTVGGVETAVPQDGTDASYSNANGTYTMDMDGNWTFDPNPNLDQSGGDIDASFDYTITDGDGDESSATQPISIEDGQDPVAGPPISLTVDDENLANGSNPNPAALTDGDDIVFTAGSDDIASIVFGDVSGLGGGLTWVRVDDDTITGSDGSDLIVTLQLTRTGDTATVEATLSDNYDSHPTFTADDLQALGSVDVIATDIDGDTATSSVAVSVSDDVPTARDDADSLSEGGPTSTDGNVITGEGTTAGLDGAGADTKGADDATVTTTGAFVGTYGTLTLNADGSYNYVLSQFGIDTMNGLSDGESVSESFDYTLTDGDLDSSDATLTITINGENDIVTINDLDGEAPELLVDEDDLSPDGSDQSDSTTDGDSFTFDSPDGLEDVTVGGEDVIVDGVFVGPVVVVGTYGTLTITGFTPNVDSAGNITSGSFDYEYTITTNTLDHDAAGEDSLFDNFEVIATDDDGDSDSAFINVEVVDDVPTAVDDTDSLNEGGPTSTSGNLITDAEANGDNGADTPGADGATIQNAGVYNLTYGTLEVNADGSYTYTLTAFGISQLETLSDGEFFTETFDYTLIDGDDDTSEATLTITLNGEDDIVTVNGLDNDAPEEVLDEDDLADGSSPDASALTQTGNFGVTSPDGLDDVQVNSVDVVVDGAFVGPVEVANDGVYSVTITGWTPTFAADGVTVISATFDYEATLLDNTLAHDELGQDDIVNMLTVTADDQDGSNDSAVLDIQIIDDVPTARDNSNSVTEGGSTGGNVISDNDGDGIDMPGADGLASPGSVVGVASTNEGTSDLIANGDGNFILAGEFGTLTLNQDGTYTYVSDANATNVDAQDVFTYTIIDQDGDTSTATLTIDIDNVEGQVSDNEVLVDEDGLAGPPAGTNSGTDSEIDADGQITVTDAVGPFTYVLVGTNSDGDGDYGTLVLDGNTGAYTYTLDTAFTTSPDANNGENQESPSTESFAYEVYDSNNNLIGSGSIDVTIVDDVPTATNNENTAAEGATVGGNVLTDDDGAGV